MLKIINIIIKLARKKDISKKKGKIELGGKKII